MIRTLLFTLIIVPCIISMSILKEYLPNLPFGEYKMYARAIVKCKPMEENYIYANCYMHKTSVNTSEIRGNITFNKPLDDSFDIHLNMAVKDSIGGWKENAMVFHSSKACTRTLNFFGPALPIVENTFGGIWTCPLPARTYVSKGLNVPNLVSKMNLPKQLFYGTYRHRIEVTDNKKKQAFCTNIIMDVKRPWESE